MHSHLTLLLVDDHVLLREALALLLEHTWPGVQVLQAGDLESACQLADSHPELQLVLLDLGLPDAQGLRSLQVLQARAPWARHVVLSAHDQPALVLQAIETGAAGFIPKTADLRQMQGALQCVLAGGISLPAGLAAPAGSGAPSVVLTPRQQEVLGLLIDGHSNKAICRRMGVANSTVKTHLEAIFRALGVNSRAQAVVAASRLGLQLPLAPAPAPLR
ncbi:response regulator transcription factor [Pseudaquabacterium pictum]|uniref:DNA-binding response regulator n=1 Tax=Pseudaquabacterium pictum TaxID=2315236 RepID=A0A480AY26_9BURK|nr:response regulator transcription factor [Rubrivivax pictus]GCL65027.1 DNA-binding response regulator [Rubrivivax pictus]